MTKPVFRKFIEVDKHQIWSVKWQNNGQPVVLLHGGLSHTAKWEKQILPAVAKTHQPLHMTELRMDTQRLDLVTCTLIFK